MRQNRIHLLPRPVESLRSDEQGTVVLMVAPEAVAATATRRTG